MRARQTDRFERLSFECELRANPASVTVRCAFVDWLVEHGFKLMGAKCIATRIVREATEERQRERVETWIMSEGKNQKRVQEAIRAAVMEDAGFRMPVQVVPGGQRPAIVGDIFLVEFTDMDSETILTRAGVETFGRVIGGNYPRVIVGAAWVENKMHDMNIGYPRSR